ncbi:hypothetical protein [Paenibacillus ehimensis]|uniref:hypothetical protein n=1 Tax=Paenibacillus ehimensis TaxID=79264 RepID=UPI00046F9E77|nr:hypothetical protein [Paenibacillus ehimensis]
MKINKLVHENLNKSYSLKTILLFAFFAFFAMVYQIIPIKNVLYDVYKWHISQPQTFYGIIELLIFFFFLSVGAYYLKNNLLKFFVYLIIFFYLFMHDVLLSSIVGVLYFETIIMFGFFIIKLTVKSIETNRKFSLNHYIISFIVGFIGWQLCALGLSLIGYGTFTSLRILTLIIGIVSFIGLRRYLPLTIKLMNRFSEFAFKEKFFSLFLLIIIFIQFGKITFAYDYDSIWYGLRPEKVLVGQYSFYDNLQLVDFVYFYPKMFELFLLPVSNLGNYSYILVINIMILAMLILVIYKIGRSLNLSVFLALLVTIVITSLPVVANMSSTAKPDLFTTLLIVMSFLFFIEFVSNQKINNLTLAISCLILSLGGKVTSLAFGGTAFLGCIICLLINYRTLFLRKLISNIQGLMLLISSLIVIIGIWYRTYLLTGFPLYPFLGKLWAVLGFSASYPYSIKDGGETIELTGFTGVIKRWYQLFFDPKDFPHVIMLWTGNIALFLFVTCAAYFIFRFKKIKDVEFVGNIKKLLTLILPVILTGLFLASFFPKGGDANYYLPAIVVSLLAMFVLISHITSNRTRKIIICSLIAFLPLQFFVMFISHSSWNYGISQASINKQDSTANTYDYKRNIFTKLGVFEIEKYLTRQDSKYSSQNIYLQSDKGWTFLADGNGYKDIKLSSIEIIGLNESQSYTIYRNDKVLTLNDNLNQPDQVTIRFWEVDKPLIVSISDKETGWGENQIPSENLIKAFLNGWKYTGDGIKHTWISVNNERQSNSLEEVVSEKILPNSIYKITSHTNNGDNDTLSQLLGNLTGSQKSYPRCIGFGPEQILNQLSCRFEDIPHIASELLGNSNIIKSKEDFMNFIKWSQTQYLIVPYKKVEGYEKVFSWLEAIENDYQLVRFQDKEYYLLDISSISF